MALFSGGRYIRAQLRQVGPEFWNLSPSGEKYGNIDDRLCFWIFEGDRDGEDFRMEFKQRFMEVEPCLTEAEKEQVVQEAVYIMGTLIGVVEEIASVVSNTKSAQHPRLLTGKRAWTRGDERLDDHNKQLREEDEPSMQRLLLKHLLPLGMVELMNEAAKVLMLAIGSCKAAGDGEV